MSMHQIDLSRADLNLLIVFETLLQTRHVGRAAERLNLSQSALSHALARLRDWLGDPLFVRHPKGVSPTPRALDLAGPLARALAEVRALVGASAPFEPRSARLALRLGATDYAVAVVLAPLLSRLREEAPGLDLRVRPVDRDAIPVLLDAGEVDLVLAHVPDPPRRFARTVLLEERFVGLARRGHPVLRRPTLDSLLAWPHALVSPRGDGTGLFDAALAEVGRTRRVAVTVPQFLALGHVVAAGDLIGIAPERAARLFVRGGAVQTFALPVEVPGFTLDLVMRTERAAEPHLAWLSAVLRDATS